jgi:hypothetical protein
VGCQKGQGRSQRVTGVTVVTEARKGSLGGPKEPQEGFRKGSGS